VLFWLHWVLLFDGVDAELFALGYVVLFKMVDAELLGDGLLVTLGFGATVGAAEDS